MLVNDRLLRHWRVCNREIAKEVPLSSLPGPPVARDAETTRARLLTAAMSLFAERGFAQAGVREIAAKAGVNASLVARYFGSKEALFRAALEAAVVMEPVLPANPRHMGQRVSAIFADMAGAPNPLAMIILSAADPAARAISIEVLERRVLLPLAAYLGPPHAEARAAQLQILWSGFLTARQLLPLAPLEDPHLPAMLQWLARQTQAIVDEGLAG
jgi:AcrR family transcriptional regulator